MERFSGLPPRLGEASRDGAIDVLGQGVEFLSSISLPVTGLLILVTAAAAYREHREGKLGPGQFPRFAAALVLAFLLGSKVLSPQYVIWLLPLVPLSAGGVWGLGVSAFFLGICWMTTQIFPFYYLEISSARSPGIDILLGCNLLLIVLWALILCLPYTSNTVSKPEKPSSEQRAPS